MCVLEGEREDRNEGKIGRKRECSSVNDKDVCV